MTCPGWPTIPPPWGEFTLSRAAPVLPGRSPPSRRPLPGLPFQNGQKGQSSPCGKSRPSSWGQPRLPCVRPAKRVRDPPV
jgi:hypothetical protein